MCSRTTLTKYLESKHNRPNIRQNTECSANSLGAARTPNTVFLHLSQTVTNVLWHFVNIQSNIRALFASSEAEADDKSPKLISPTILRSGESELGPEIIRLRHKKRNWENYKHSCCSLYDQRSAVHPAGLRASARAWVSVRVSVSTKDKWHMCVASCQVASHSTRLTEVFDPSDYFGIKLIFWAIVSQHENGI